MNQPPEVINNTRKILGSVKQTLMHQAEIAMLKGENFNVFSILKMESRENDTHSAFLGELLNPKGSHNFGNVFLQLFLNQIDNTSLDVNNATVVLEYSIGANDHVNMTGGRVDIYIKDSSGNTICIENKIYASDQPNQLKRYVNYNNAKNTVYYLTLNGEDATKESKKDLLIDVDYTCLSYHTNIIEWLEACCKEVTDQPIIRESIKQYIILLKKLTNQLSDAKMEKEIKDLITANYTAATTISSNIGAVELKYTEDFIKEVVAQIKSELSTNWDIQTDPDLNNTWKGIRIYNKNWPPKIHIKLEGASRIPWDNSIYGVKAQKKEYDRLKIKQALSKIEMLEKDFRESEVWPYYKTILNFGKAEERAKLFKDSSRKDLVSMLSTAIKDLCLVCEQPLSELK
tara:strand:- start:15462 stop:16664 length:1203 start_codon:yes stop_codon:yes gene_type:complete